MNMNKTQIIIYGALVFLLTGVTMHTVNVEQQRPKRHEQVCSMLPQPHPDCTYTSQAADKNRSFEYD